MRIIRAKHLSRVAAALCFVGSLSLSVDAAQAASWEIVSDNDGQGFWCESMSFGDDTNGFMVNDKKLLATTNGGETWELVDSTPERRGFDDIHFHSATHGVIMTHTIDTDLIRSVWITTDGGDSWDEAVIPDFEPIPVPSGNGRLAFVDSQVGFLTFGPNLAKTTDGGQTWSAIDISDFPITGTHELAFSSEDVFYASSNKHPHGHGIFKTVDGGNTWTQVFEFSGGTSRALYFFDNDFGFIRGYMRTIDGGDSWEEPGEFPEYEDRGQLNPGWDWRLMDFASETNGFAAISTNQNHHLLISTTDGGITWTLDDLPEGWEPWNGMQDCMDYVTPSVAYVAVRTAGLTKGTVLRFGTPTGEGGTSPDNNDAGNNDAGNNDSGNNDAGNNDAGNNDAGNNDAGNNDAGNNDAGNNDAGNNDAGNNTPESADSDGDSACSTAGSVAPGNTGTIIAVMLMGLIVLMAQRRRVVS